MDYVVELAGQEYLSVDSEVHQCNLLDSGALEIRRLGEEGEVESIPLMVFSPSGWRLIRPARFPDPPGSTELVIRSRSPL